MNTTSIEWCRTFNADGTFTEGYSVNPIRFRPAGSERALNMCHKIGPGCVNCYAASITRRWWPKGQEFPGYTALGVLAGEFFLDEDMLASVLKHKKPGRVFWCDMTDIFGDWVKDEWLDRIFAVMALTPHLTHLVLTKRSDRMRSYFTTILRDDGTSAKTEVRMMYERPARFFPRAFKHLPLNQDPFMLKWPLPNVWLGVSVENQETSKRVWSLLETPAHVRYVSAEPLLASVNFHDIEALCSSWRRGATLGRYLDWIIVGGESGPKARPFNVQWARDIIKQCEGTATAVFVKQMGSSPMIPLPEFGLTLRGKLKVERDECLLWPEGTHFGNRTGNPEFNGRQILLKDGKGGDINEWPMDLRVRQYPEVIYG